MKKSLIFLAIAIAISLVIVDTTYNVIFYSSLGTGFYGFFYGTIAILLGCFKPVLAFVFILFLKRGNLLESVLPALFFVVLVLISLGDAL